MKNSGGWFTRNRLIGLAALVVLVVAMVLNTRFLTPEELAAAGPVQFDPKKTAEELFAKAKAELPAKAAPVPDVVSGIQSDPAATAEELGAASPAEGTYVFAVTAEGTVTQASPASIRLDVPGVPSETAIIVPLTTAVNGTVLRDAMGFKFADAPGQTDYQYVGDELKKLIQAEVANVGDPASLEGKKVSVVGVTSVLTTGGPVPQAKPINIQPLTLEVTS